MYHDRTAWRCAFFVGKKYGSKGYPHTGNAAHMGSQLGFVTYLLNYLRNRQSDNKQFLLIIVNLLIKNNHMAAL
jgi:hypothetical protein